MSSKTNRRISSEKRTALLVDVLTKIANKVYEAISNKPSRIALAREMAQGLFKILFIQLCKWILRNLQRLRWSAIIYRNHLQVKQTRKHDIFANL